MLVRCAAHDWRHTLKAGSGEPYRSLLDCWNALARPATGYSKKAQQMVQSRAIQSMLIVTISMFALTIAAVGQALGESSLDTSYIVSFARVPVGEFTASLVVSNTEYKISARGRAGGMVKVLLDGEGSFITQGTNVDGGLEPKSFTSKIVSNKGTSEVSMAFDEDSVKELVAAPLPGSDRVPVPSRTDKLSLIL